MTRRMEWEARKSVDETFYYINPLTLSRLLPAAAFLVGRFRKAAAVHDDRKQNKNERNDGTVEHPVELISLFSPVGRLVSGREFEQISVVHSQLRHRQFVEE